MSAIAGWLEQAGTVITSVGIVIGAIGGLILTWRKAAKDAKAVAAPPTSDTQPGHMVIVQTRLGEMVTVLAAMSPVLAKMLVFMDAAKDSLESVERASERAAASSERIEHSHGAYIASSTQAMHSTEGNTRIIGQTMAQVRDEVQGVSRQIREIVARSQERDVRRGHD